MDPELASAIDDAKGRRSDARDELRAAKAAYAEQEWTPGEVADWMREFEQLEANIKLEDRRIRMLRKMAVE